MSNETDILDILDIDKKIIKKYEEEKTKILEYQEKLDMLRRTYLSNNLKHSMFLDIEKEINRLEEYIDNIENNIDMNFYLVETSEIIENYKNFLKMPLKMNFMGKQNRNDKEKKKLFNQYINIACKYIDIDIDILNNSNRKDSKIVCINVDCNNKKDFDIVDTNLYICNKCFAQQVINKDVLTSFGDVERVNISTKYVYDRRIHFRDCINQYQGKQNCTIPQKVYDDLEEQFTLHHLLVGDKNTPKEVRFSNITKTHIMMFLNDLGYSKHYENIHLIHYVFTGTKPDDISHLEDRLMNDFDLLTQTYDRMFKHLKRKNFINTQFILYQLLHKYKHPCKIEKSMILTTNDRRVFHEELCSSLFHELGFEYNSFF
jgi:hypothetical protein